MSECVDCCEPATSPNGRCRDCDIDHSLDSMQCSGCQRMRYRQDSLASAWGAYFWGDPCACPEPRPQTMAEFNRTGAS